VTRSAKTIDLFGQRGKDGPSFAQETWLSNAFVTHARYHAYFFQNAHSKWSALP